MEHYVGLAVEPQDVVLGKAESADGFIRVHAAKLAVESGVQIIRRYCGPLLLCLEHAHRSALEHHVHRSPRLGKRGLSNVRIGISN